METQTLEKPGETGVPGTESEVVGLESKPEPDADLDGKADDTGAGDGEIASPEDADAITKEEQARREAQSERDKRFAAERRAAYLEGQIAASKKPAEATPVTDPFLAKLDTVEAQIIEEYGENSTEHESFKISRYNAEANRRNEVESMSGIYENYHAIPEKTFGSHPELLKNDVLFKRFQVEVDTRFSIYGGYDEFHKAVKSGRIRLDSNLVEKVKKIFDDSHKIATGKNASVGKNLETAKKLAAQANTLGGSGAQPKPAPDNSGTSYDDAFRQTQRFNFQVFEDMK